MIKVLTEDLFEDFKQYCLTYRKELDDSFLYDEDIDAFEIGNDNPTYLLYKGNELEGVCSIMQDEYHLRGGKARVRIFHCRNDRQEDYETLLDKTFPLDPRVERVVLFIPSENLVTNAIAEKLGFFIERYSYAMVRIDKEPNEYLFSDGYELTDMVIGRDEADYLHVRNTAFSTIRGSETPQTIDQVKEFMKPGKILEGGAKILRYKGEPVGVIRMEHENDQGKDYSFVAPLAILPGYQGKGLGSNLLRAGIQVGVDNGYKDCMLTVNVENEGALKLYLKEGFETISKVICYHLKVQ